MTVKLRNIVTLSLLLLILLGCDALPLSRTVPTLVPTIALTYVVPQAGQPNAPVPAAELAVPTQTTVFEEALAPSPTVDLLPPGETATLPLPTVGDPAAGGYPYPAPDLSDPTDSPDSAQRANPANQAAAGEPTQTPVAVMIIGFADTPAPGSPAYPAGEPTSTTEPGSPDVTDEPTQPADDGGDGGEGAVEEWGNFYLIVVGDNGASGQPAGCGDSLIEMSLPLETPTNDPLSASLEMLLAQKEQYVGDLELYNPLWQSDLTLDSASIVAGGTAQIVLSGQLNLVESCDGQRVKDMLEATAMRVPGVQSTSITLNDLSIDEALPDS